MQVYDLHSNMSAVRAQVKKSEADICAMLQKLKNVMIGWQ